MKSYLYFILIFCALMLIPSCRPASSPLYPNDYQGGYNFGESTAKMDSMECLSSGLYGNHSLIIDNLEKKHMNELGDKKSEAFIEGFKKSYRYYIWVYYPAYCND
ncbi:MAG: hypothetical protein WC836_01760 [Desulfobacula sp.]